MSGSKPVPPTSMRETLILQKRKKRFTELYLDGGLPFVWREELDVECACCGLGPYTEKRWKHDDQGERIPGSEHDHLVKLCMLDWEEGLWCRSCFGIHWCYLPHAGSSGMSGSGSPAPATPASQREYEGGNFHSGEW